MQASETGGVKPMPIQGRMARERERILGMTTEERKWRAQYLKDQHLSKNEPCNVSEYYKEIRNPIRRAYMAPLDTITKVLTPVIGFKPAYAIRFFTGKFLMIGMGIYATVYYFKYNANDWTRKGGWRMISSRPLSTPGTEGWPKISERSKPQDYADRGFKAAPI
uniref:CSON000136 protein n=1 Tax=Culicoides sonorensis TaxID=179676 RepID=A0A336K4K4_CULSO